MGKDTEKRRIPWVLVYLACLLAFCTEIVDCIILPPIHWNASNPMFKTSNNDHVIQVNMYDELDFICPTFNEWEDSVTLSEMEYYIIYQVSKKEYDDCYIYPETKAIMIVNCSSPNQRKRFTILFEPFASIPHVPEFKKGTAYYYISTSTGMRDGITNVQQGACLYRNMKLTISVCCEDRTTSNPINVTTVTNTPDMTYPSPTTSETLLVTLTTQTENEATTTTTLAPTTTTTTRRPTRRPSTRRPVTSTTAHHTKYTDKEIDRTSHKPGNKDKDNDNNVNKDSDSPDNNPKQEGLVNKALTLMPCSRLLTILSLLSLSWLRR